MKIKPAKQICLAGFILKRGFSSTIQKINSYKFLKSERGWGKYEFE